MGFRGWFEVVKETIQDYGKDKASRLAAALAYYTLFSITPLALIAIAIVGTIYGKEAASGAIAQQISKTVSPQVAGVVQGLVANASHRSSMMGAYGVGAIVLLIGAAGVFSQLKGALNTVWNVQPKKSGGLIGFLRSYVLSFSMVLVVGFLLLVSLVLSAGLEAIASKANSVLPIPGVMAHVVEAVISLIVFTVLFAAMFKILPDADVNWAEVWHGAFLTALLFSIGKYLIGLYLGRSSVASAYGAAGSLILLLLWVDYSAQIFLFGAEFTKVFARRTGTQIESAADAARQAPPARAA